MPRILFVKTSSLGDVVHQCPAVSDAARELAGAQIDWVVEEAFAGIARMHGAVRSVIPVAVRRWRGALGQRATWREMAQFRRRLAAERYDVVVDTQGLLKSALIARGASGVRHGMDRSSTREAIAASFYDITHAVPRALHAVERNRRLTAASLGYAVEGPPDYGLSVNEERPSGEPYAVLLTMTSRADKLWPEAHWVDLGRALSLPIVLPWGNASERARAERIGRAIGQAVIPEAMALDALATLFSHARGVVGLDSGLTHLAAALGAPTVGIYCASDPFLTGLYGATRATNLGARGKPPEVSEVLESFG